MPSPRIPPPSAVSAGTAASQLAAKNITAPLRAISPESEANGCEAAAITARRKGIPHAEPEIGASGVEDESGPQVSSSRHEANANPGEHRLFRLFIFG